jgi:A/G-specific adenine glycosylase
MIYGEIKEKFNFLPHGFVKLIIFIKNQQLLAKKLLQWHKSINNRQLPWKEEKDPYKIWLSEILLQQTRAEVVIAYYLKFIKAYPSINSLANAPEEEVFVLWQGLGYYSRCRNLIATARMVVELYNGQFPNNYKDIIALKGIGPYTASAIASFAFDLPYAVLDGNVYRILSRLFASDIPIDSNEGKLFFQQKADELLAKKSPAQYNQAIMDLGATICKPKQMLCPQCPWQKDCTAFANDSVALYPVKSKKLKIKNRFFHYLVFDDGRHLYITKRVQKDIWQDLFQFALIESTSPQLPLPTDWNYLMQMPYTSHQLLTHQKIECNFYHIDTKPSKQIIKQFDLQKIEYNNLASFAWPKSINDYLIKKLYLSSY